MTSLILAAMLSLCDVQRVSSTLYPHKDNPEWMDDVRKVVLLQTKQMKIKSLFAIGEKKKDFINVKWGDWYTDEMSNIHVRKNRVSYWIVTEVCQEYTR